MSSRLRHLNSKKMRITVTPPERLDARTPPEPAISVVPPEAFRAEPSMKLRAEQAPKQAPKQGTGPIAILVCHGMGQQVPFETLDCVAKTIVDSRNAENPTANVRLLHSESDERMPRAELNFTLAGTGKNVEVHLYEAYWAPVTEGQVRLHDAVRFLLGAGWHGIGFSLRGKFERRMFGKEAAMPLRRDTGLVLFFALLSIGSVIGLSFAAFLLTDGEIIRAFYPGFPSVPLLSDVSRILSLYMFFIIPIAAIIIIAMIGPIRKAIERNPRACGILRPILNALAIVALTITIGTFLILLCHIPNVIRATAQSTSLPADPPRTSHLILAIIIWLLGVLTLVQIRNFLVQYVGDVAAYVSSHTVSRFSDIRNKIQAICLNVAAFIYGAKRADGSGNLYDHVIVVGHSLGSVVAYDTLNSIINRAIIGAADGSGNRTKPDVVERTKMFLTFGSPLDKTAFIFRSQLKDAIFREALAEAVQPLIQSYSYRPARWVNIYSPADWISGALDFYDDPVATTQKEQEAERAIEPERIENRPDRNAFLPLAAHTGYWNHSEVGTVLFEAIREIVDKNG